MTELEWIWLLDPLVIYVRCLQLSQDSTMSSMSSIIISIIIKCFGFGFVIDQEPIKSMHLPQAEKVWLPLLCSVSAFAKS